jgi:GNAT superfamily N-acetyltransferase
MEHDRIIVRKATLSDIQYAATITDEMEASAKARGTGIGKRPVSTIIDKIKQGKAVIALTADKVWVGFSYIEIWGHGEYVSNSGLIVNPVFRNLGIASRIKKRIFRLSRELYPAAKVFSITSGLAIMKMNTKLGFEPVTFSEITKDEHFWAGCKGCVNYDILTQKDFKHCICTAMLYTPHEHGVMQEAGIGKEQVATIGKEQVVLS